MNAFDGSLMREVVDSRFAPDELEPSPLSLECASYAHSS